MSIPCIFFPVIFLPRLTNQSPTTAHNHSLERTSLSSISFNCSIYIGAFVLYFTYTHNKCSTHFITCSARLYWVQHILSPRLIPTLRNPLSSDSLLIPSLWSSLQVCPWSPHLAHLSPRAPSRQSWTRGVIKPLPPLSLGDLNRMLQWFLSLGENEPPGDKILLPLPHRRENERKKKCKMILEMVQTKVGLVCMSINISILHLSALSVTSKSGLY